MYRDLPDILVVECELVINVSCSVPNRVSPVAVLLFATAEQPVTLKCRDVADLS
jgi:hypothetical protein